MSRRANKMKRQERLQKALPIAMIVCVVLAFIGMFTATIIMKASWKANIIVAVSVGLVLLTGLLKIKYDRLNVDIYNGK